MFGCILKSGVYPLGNMLCSTAWEGHLVPKFSIIWQLSPVFAMNSTQYMLVVSPLRMVEFMAGQFVNGGIFGLLGDCCKNGSKAHIAMFCRDVASSRSSLRMRSWATHEAFPMVPISGWSHIFKNWLLYMLCIPMMSPPHIPNILAGDQNTSKWYLSIDGDAEHAWTRTHARENARVFVRENVRCNPRIYVR